MNPLAYMDTLGRLVWDERKALRQPLWLLFGSLFFFSVLSAALNLLLVPTPDPTNPDMAATAITWLVLLIAMPVQYLAMCWLGLCLDARTEGAPMPPLKAALQGRFVGAILLSLAFLALSMVVALPGIIVFVVGYFIALMLTVCIAMGMGSVLLAATLRGHSLSAAIRIATQPTHIGIRWGAGHWKTYLLLGAAMLGFLYGLTSATQIITFVLAFGSAFQGGIGNPSAAIEMTRTMQLSSLLSAPIISVASTLSMAVTVGGSLWLARRIDRQKAGDDILGLVERLEASA